LWQELSRSLFSLRNVSSRRQSLIHRPPGHSEKLRRIIDNVKATCQTRCLPYRNSSARMLSAKCVAKVPQHFPRGSMSTFAGYFKVKKRVNDSQAMTTSRVFHPCGVISESNSPTAIITKTFISLKDSLIFCNDCQVYIVLHIFLCKILNIWNSNVRWMAVASGGTVPKNIIFASFFFSNNPKTKQSFDFCCQTLRFLFLRICIAGNSFHCGC